MTDPTTPDERQVRDRIKPGLYRVFWRDEEGHSVCAIGMEPNGDNWIAPTNWVAPTTVRKIDRGDWAVIDRLEEIDTRPAPEAPTARADALVWVEHDRFLDGWGVPDNCIVRFQGGNITTYSTDPRAIAISEYPFSADQPATPQPGTVAQAEKLREVLDMIFSTYRAKNGRDVGIEDDMGEKVWLLSDDGYQILRALSGPADRDQELTSPYGDNNPPV